ncbi:helix-turn-helix domain-containing protein [Paenibacillus koleovorans]|uniref:helix-turn-helix domain-containing protein n=1 Tax=Paenibacillus koleovorans TaxID=121608 RepID=UPI000FD862DF|nr:AraC family transcriptional regulator [Paenibacillus koleovorans]
MKRTGSGNFYRRNVAMILFAAGIPAILIGIVIYWLQIKIADEFTASHQDQVEKVAQRLNAQFVSLEMSLSHWAFNPVFNEKWSGMALVSDNFQEVNDVIKTLLLIKNLDPMIQNASFYLTRQNAVITELGVRRLEPGVGEADRYRAYMTMNQAIAWKTSPSLPGSPEQAPALVVRLPALSTAPYGGLIVQFRHDAFPGLMNQLAVQQQSVSLLLQGDGSRIAGSSGVADEGLADRLSAFAAAQSLGSYTWPWSGKTYAVTIGSFQRLNSSWRYVSATSMSSITQPIAVWSRSLIALSLVSLAAAIVLSWLGSHRLYRPMRQLVRLFRVDNIRLDGVNELAYIENEWRGLLSEKDAVQAQLRQQQPFLRSGLLLQMLLGFLPPMREEELRERLSIGQRMEPSEIFAVMIVRLYAPALRSRKFAASDRSLVSFVAANVAEEIVQRHAAYASVVNFQDESAAVLLQIVEQKSEGAQRAELSVIAGEITETLYSITGYHAVIGISRPIERISAVPFAFEEARNVMHSRDLRTGNQIFFVEDAPSANKRPFIYPAFLEKELLGNIRLGDGEQSIGYLDAFFDELKVKSVDEFSYRQGAYQLLACILQMFIEAGHNPYPLFENKDLYAHLSSIRDTSDIKDWLRDGVIAPIAAAMRTDKEDYVRRKVDEVIALIQFNLTKDLSMEWCADAVALDYKQLSRAFKQQTGYTFIDYVTRLRLAKSKELLRDPSLKINDIADSVGYQPSYLNRVFKKYEGITPGQYREHVLNIKP